MEKIDFLTGNGRTGSRVGILKIRLGLLPTFARVTQHRSKELHKRMKFHSSLKVNSTEGKTLFIDLTDLILAKFQSSAETSG